MAKDIKTTLAESTDGLLSEEALNEIEAAFNEAVEERATINVESALAKQDEDHAEKVEQLLEAIDSDHTKKLHHIVEAVTQNHTHKLKQVVHKYQQELNESAGDFKGSLISTVSDYLDLYLETTFPKDMMNEAVANKRSDNVISELRKILAVDMALAKDEIKDAIVDGKQQINEASNKLEQFEKENTTLKTELASVKASQVLNDLSAKLPEHKKKYVHKVLGDKTAEFITENFDYTLELFDKESAKKNETLKEEAVQTAKGNVDAVTEEVQVVNETTSAQDDDDDPILSSYMGELGKY